VNLISLKDDRSSSIFLPVSFSSLYFFSLRLMSLMLIQLIQYAGNLVDFWGLLRSSCRADFTIDDDDKDVVDPFVDKEELVVIKVNATEATDIMEDEGTPFLMDAEQK
jgi:hypothetical protein